MNEENAPMRCLLAGLMLLAAPAPAFAGNVGFQLLSVPYDGDTAIQVGLWYPTTAAPQQHSVGLLKQVVAENGPVTPGAHPLIVVSHGSGGGLASHVDTALALATAGFVVAAPTHPGDNYRDASQAVQVQRRPGHIRAVLDYLLVAWPGRAALDPLRVGMFGFSSGDFTALVIAGGVPDLARVGPWCQTHATSFTCGIARQGHATDHPYLGSWAADKRVRAIVVAAPALGFTFPPRGLEAVRVPVQLWGAADDHVLAAPDFADAVYHALPTPPEYRVVDGADHFDFLAPCTPALAQVAPPICQEPAGFDRAAFHRSFDEAVVSFFSRALD